MKSIAILILGQAIPPGLHVRLNMKTGKKEAKLLSESELESDAKLPGSIHVK